MPSLFHYTSIDTFIDHIWPSGMIRTGKLDLTNDPRETSRWSFGGTNVPYEEMFAGFYNEKNHIECVYRLGQMIKDRLQLICFSGACRTGWNNEMMWAHYGSNHKGICIEFDEDLLLQAVKDTHPDQKFVLDNIDYHSGKIKDWIYWDKQRSVEENLFQAIERMHKSLVLTKSNFWEKEDERRLLFLNTNDHLFIPVKKAIKAIHIGVKFPSAEIAALQETICKAGINFFMLIYQQNRFERWLLEKNSEGKLRSSRKKEDCPE